MFYFGLFLPLVFITASFSLTQKQQLFNSLLSSVSILFIFFLGLLLNRTVGVLSFLNFEEVVYFNGFESPKTVAIMVVFLFVFMMSSVFFRGNLKRSLTPWSLALVYASIFLVTTLVATQNLLIFLFACESFIWLNLFQLNTSKENKKSLYFQSSISTALLLVLTIFFGLLESISLSEMTYSAENLSKLSLSYVSGTIYSTQTLFFIMASIYVALKSSFLLHIITLKLVEKNIKLTGLLLVILGIPTIVYCFYSHQSHFYELAYKEYGVIALASSIVGVLALYLYHFQNHFFAWSRKWTD